MMNILFDYYDRNLLDILNSLSKKQSANSLFSDNEQKLLFSSHMHPRGIKELVNPKVVRVAKTLYHLVDTLEEGKVEERLSALHSLRDEVFFSAKSGMTKNTARVLLSVMKDLIREKNKTRRLELSHDFHSVMTGKPVIVRKYLKKYHLLEMPEAWNQITFDHHVHDAHTKGRKNPCHLIMDAWIKGIRDLQVIYYDYIPREAARELLTAAEYMGINIRIGIDFPAVFRDKEIHFIWTPRGFKGTNHFITFLTKEKVLKFFNQGREATAYREKIILAKFHYFNDNQRKIMNEQYHLSVPPLKEDELREIVGNGQLSLLHVSEYIHQKIMTEVSSHIDTLRGEYLKADKKRQAEISQYFDDVNILTSEFIFTSYLKSSNKCLENDPDKPEILTLSPKKLISTLDDLHLSFRITLNLTGLNVTDVIELVYQNDGRINNLEIFNYKDYAKGLSKNYPEIREFQHALNERNIIKLKKIILSVLAELDESDAPDKEDRIGSMYEILNNLPRLLNMYHDKLLKDKIGSDSTGRSNQLYGMGFAIMETLPQTAQKEIKRTRKHNSVIMPIFIEPLLVKIFAPLNNTKNHSYVLKYWLSSIISGGIFKKISTKWESEGYSFNVKHFNNIIALGARPNNTGNGFSLSEKEYTGLNLHSKWIYLNTGLKNALKISMGFIPAFLTFYLTKHWWVLAYLGAPIWFGITGLRNILQSVFGGDSFKRSPLLNWKDYINWDRISDSLLYTGFSVPLLDFIVKHLILDVGFNINTSTNVIALYTYMALVNGIYISTHNFFRGLPPAAIFGNFFRSILSIPIAIAFNTLIGQLLIAFGVTGVTAILQKWAAVISKAASDSVAGVIEGTADRNTYIRLRSQDYKLKLDKMYETYVKMDLLQPDRDLLLALKNPKNVIQTIKVEDPQLLPLLIFDALDFLYFWMYQPHARTVLRRIVKSMTPEEKIIFRRFQYVLRRKQQITEMFAGGLVGENFSRALAFYLNRSDSYLKAIDHLLA